MSALRRWLAVRARLVGRFFLVGTALGALGVPLALALGYSVVAASENVFALGALVFGFALLGWSGSAFAGSTIETMHGYLDPNSRWTEADSRRAMAVLGALGFGAMVGSALATVALWELGA